jgi:hypothetical protein
MVNQWRHLPVCVSGQLAAAGYLFDADSGRYRPCALDVLALEHGRVRAVLAFLASFGVSSDGLGERSGPAVIDFARYGLPELLSAS